MMRYLLGAVCVLGAACAPVDTTDPGTASDAMVADVGSVDGTIPSSQVVAVVDGHLITRDEVMTRVDELSPLLRRQFDTPQGRRAFLRSLVDRHLLVAEGRRRAVHRSPDIRRRVQAFEDRLVARAMTEAASAEALDDAALERFFTRNREDFRIPEAVEVGRIALLWGASSSPRARRDLVRRAESLRRTLLGGAPFAEVAAQGAGPEREHGGRLGWRAAGEFDDERLEAAALALRSPGALSPPVETDDGVFIFKLFARRAARQPDFGEVRGQVLARYRMHGERAAFDRLVDALRDDAAIELFPENLQE